MYRRQRACPSMFATWYAFISVAAYLIVCLRFLPHRLRKPANCVQARNWLEHAPHLYSSHDPPLVSICIPVYNGSHLVLDALRSVLDQTYTNFELIISFDDSADTAASVLQVRAFLESHPAQVRVHTFTQQKPLGWIANTNFLLARANGAYAMVLPHDDTIPSNYLTKLQACLQSHPAAVNCYPRRCQSSFKTGTPLCKHVLRQKNITGTVDSRVYQSLLQTAGVSFRGLVRRQGLRGFAPFLLQPMHKNHSAADLIQITQHAIVGDLLEVDVPYYKLLHPSSVYETEGTRLTTNDQVHAFIDRMVHTYNLASMHVASSHKLHVHCKKLIADYIHQRNIDAGALWNPWGVAPTTPQMSPKQALSAFNQGIHRRQRVAVLGGGIQGCTMAMLFAKHGYDVTIYDKADNIMQRASNNQEGKIHLGFVYSMDHSMQTAKYMMRSALWFARYLEYLLGKTIDWGSIKSRPFLYLVPHTSLISPKDLEAFFSDLQSIYTSMITQDQELNYLGETPRHLFKRIPVPAKYNKSYFAAAFETEEYALDQKHLHNMISASLEQQGVRLLFNATVKRVRRTKASQTGKFRISSTRGTHDVDVVVNCLWEGRAAVDDQMNVPNWSGDNVRLKFGIKSAYIDDLGDAPSVTIVNGPFGDFVNYANQHRMYFSWYSTSMQGMVSLNQTLPTEWLKYMAGAIPADLSKAQIDLHAAQFKMMFCMAQLRLDCSKVVAGTILGNGNKDVDQPDSGLHSRSDTPVKHVDGYYSISTQKYTSAPYNARLLEQMLAGQRQE